MSLAQIFPGPVIGMAQGVLLIIFRKKISIFLEKIFKCFPTNKISEQFYKISYKVNPLYIALLGVIFIALSVIAVFQ